MVSVNHRDIWYLWSVAAYQDEAADFMDLEDDILREEILKAYGAEVVLTPAEQRMPGAIAKALELQKQIPNSFIPQQFENPANPKVHYETTGPEIYEDLDGDVDYFVAGVGTGGTISGVGKYLKEKSSQVKVVAVEPASSSILSGGEAGAHKIQGIGAGFVPKNYKQEYVDKVVAVSDENAIKTAVDFTKNEGILVGISSGAAIYAAIEIAKKLGKGKKVLAIAPDGGEKYISMGIYE